MNSSSRLSNLPPYPFARWSQRVEEVRRQGKDVIRLDMGNPDMPPPTEVVEAMCQAARQDQGHGYAGYRGIPALREAIAAYYERRFAVQLDPNREVLPLIGSKEGIVHMALAQLDPGDLALVPDPGYACYEMGAGLAGAKVYPFRLQSERGFLPDLRAIPAGVAEKAKLMWLNYPNNPTGATADLEFLAEAVDFARRHRILLCHDAPYCDITYDGYKAPSVLQVPGSEGVALEFNSLSKTYNMAGWRVGMAVGNADALAALGRVKTNVDSGIFLPMQDAAVAALSTDPHWVAARNDVYAERLDAVCAGLAAAGMEARRPRATLYAWARIPQASQENPGWTSEAFAVALLESTGVSLAPGPFFGPAGEGYVRLSITVPTAQVQEAMQRLRHFCGGKL